MTETLSSASPPEDVAVSPLDVAKDHDPGLEGSAQPSVEEFEIARELLRTARARGVALTGPDGMSKALTKTAIETPLDEEMSEHLGYDKHQVAGRNGGSSRNGVRTKTVLTDNVGPIEITVPRDRDGPDSPVVPSEPPGERHQNPESQTPQNQRPFWLQRARRSVAGGAGVVGVVYW